MLHLEKPHKGCGKPLSLGPLTGYEKDLDPESIYNKGDHGSTCKRFWKAMLIKNWV